MKYNCKVCGTECIFDYPDLKCPNCEKLYILSKKDSLQIWSKQNEWFQQKIKEIISNTEKKELLLWLLEEREILSRNFFTNNPSLKLDNFLAINLLIKKVFEQYDIIGTNLPNVYSVEKLIEYFSFFVGLQTREKLLEDEFAYYIAKEPFDIKIIDESKLMSNFKFVYNQQWMGIVQTFEDNLILTEESTSLYFKKHKKEFDDLNSIPPPIKILTPNQRIVKFYSTFKSFKVALTKNTLFAQFFDLNYLVDEKIQPDIFGKIIKGFNPKHSNETPLEVVSSKQFLKFIRRKLKGFEKHTLYEALVFSKRNKDIFPCFVELDDIVYISINFLTLMNIFYYPIYYKSLYDLETIERSKKFEEIEVPAKLEMNGFKVESNIVKKDTLQIDSIAWKNERLYVIETKIWDIRPVFENQQTHLCRIRDLRGIVDGIKYTNNNPKPIPSLIKKIDFVKNNIESLCPDYKNIKEIRGLIITKSYPPIDSYRDVKMIGFNEIDSLPLF